MHNRLREQVRAQVEGRNRQPSAAVVDSQTVRGAGNVQDRDAARPLLWAPRATFPTIALVWADAGYAGKLVDWAPPVWP
jgi:hypothetical protein